MANDNNFDKVSLLLNCNGTNGSTSIIDSSSRTKVVTPNGNVQISTTQSKFGGASLFFDGTGDYLSIPDSSDFNFGSGDFTIEFWIYLSSLPGTERFIYSKRNTISSVSDVYISVLSSGKVTCYLTTSGSSWEIANTGGSATISTGTWNHIALVRSGPYVKLFINGLEDYFGTLTGSISTSSASVIIGANVGGTDSINGYIDDFRVTKGFARYFYNFTTPTEEFPRIDINFDKVSLLLHNDGSNGSTTFTDSSLNTKTITPNGNAQISTAQSKFGGASGVFDGAGDYLRIPYSSDLNFSNGDFTIEFWVYYIPTTNFMILFDNRKGGVTGIGLFISGSSTFQNRLSMDGNGANLAGSGSNTIPSNQWSHIAVCRSSGVIYAFINGVQTWSVSDSRTYGTPTDYYIGIESGLSAYAFNGYIDDYRITKGLARYTSAFNIPPEPFPNAGLYIDPNGIIQTKVLNFSASYINCYNNTLIALNR